MMIKALFTVFFNFFEYSVIFQIFDILMLSRKRDGYRFGLIMAFSFSVQF